MTFTGRTLIWDNVIVFIKTKLIIGYGREKNTLVASKLGNGEFVDAHNTILDVLYKGGIVSLIIFFIMLILPVNELYKYRKSRITKLMAVILFSFFIMMNFEARQESIGLYMVLISCYNISYILKANNEINNEQEKQ